MKCYHCGGPCRAKDVKIITVRNRIRGYKKKPCCDFCRSLYNIDRRTAYIANVLREEIRKRK